MPASGARIATIRTATRPGGDRPNEDQVFTSGTVVAVLDGASAPDQSGSRTGGWLAGVLGAELLRRLETTPDEPLRHALASSIDAITRLHVLKPGNSPSTTVSLVRWTASTTEALVMGDSPVVALARDGRIRQARDDRLEGVARLERQRLREAGPGRPDLRQQLVDAERSNRNRPGGYWIAEAEPAAARHARIVTWDTGELDALLVVTDGVVKGVEQYGAYPDWGSAISAARRAPASLIEALHEIEAGDPDCVRWPRSKPHDDKTVAVVEFAAAPAR